MKLLVAVPAYNEAKNIGPVIEEIKLALPGAQILLIDDGSDDGTSDQARKFEVEVIELPFNLGVGGALRTAFKFAKNNGFTHLVQIDADGQHQPTMVSDLILGLNNSDIVVGSRFATSNSSYETSKLRRLAMMWLSFLTSKICKTKLTDVSSGFRIANSAAIDLFARHYPTEYLGDTVESLVIAKRAGLSISEVPVKMRSRLSGNPSQNLIRSIWYLIRATLVIFLATLHANPNKTGDK